MSDTDFSELGGLELQLNSNMALRQKVPSPRSREDYSEITSQLSGIQGFNDFDSMSSNTDGMFLNTSMESNNMLMSNQMLRKNSQLKQTLFDKLGPEPQEERKGDRQEEDYIRKQSESEKVLEDVDKEHAVDLMLIEAMEKHEIKVAAEQMGAPIRPDLMSPRAQLSSVSLGPSSNDSHSELSGSSSKQQLLSDHSAKTPSFKGFSVLNISIVKSNLNKEQREWINNLFAMYQTEPNQSERAFLLEMIESYLKEQKIQYKIKDPQ